MQHTAPRAVSVGQECQRLVGSATEAQWATPSFQCKVLVHTLLSGNRSSVDSVLQVPLALSFLTWQLCGAEESCRMAQEAHPFQHFCQPMHDDERSTVGMLT